PDKYQTALTYRYSHHLDLHSFPTRRSSDLSLLKIIFKLSGNILSSIFTSKPRILGHLSVIREVRILHLIKKLKCCGLISSALLLKISLVIHCLLGSFRRGCLNTQLLKKLILFCCLLSILSL